MRTIVAFLALVFAIVAILLIQRDAGLSLARPLPLDSGWPGVVPVLAPVAIILLTLWALSRLRGRDGSSDSSSPSQSQSEPGDAAEDASYDGDTDDSQDDDE